ncbi:MAG: LacI family DNA-binding transcriptional regulator [Enterocloster clostridioformis]
MCFTFLCKMFSFSSVFYVFFIYYYIFFSFYCQYFVKIYIFLHSPCTFLLFWCILNISLDCEVSAMSTKLTISQIADMSGVSIATVSRFINNTCRSQGQHRKKDHGSHPFSGLSTA